MSIVYIYSEVNCVNNYVGLIEIFILFLEIQYFIFKSSTEFWFNQINWTKKHFKIIWYFIFDEYIIKICHLYYIYVIKLDFRYMSYIIIQERWFVFKL